MSRNKIIFIGIGGLVFLFVIVIFLINALGSTKRPANASLQFWGTFDDPQLYTQLIRDYKNTHPNVTIEYRQFPFADYESALVNAFAAGNGPDIWLMHNTWLPKHIDLIAPVDQKTKPVSMTFKDFKDKFVDVAVADLTRGNDIYALPLYTDTLELYYNKDIFNTAGISAPPRTWEDFVHDVGILTARDDKNNLTKSAAAIGTARNINRSTDLLMLLMLQSGVKMTNADNTQATFTSQVDNINLGELAVQFYTDFANPSKPDRYTWNDQQNYSIDAFANGNTAMMLNYSHHIPTLRARNARLNFAVAPMPQPAGATTAVNFANYWAATVAKQSKNFVAAWDFINYLTAGAGTAQYLTDSNRPSARRDLIETQRTDPDLGPFAIGALNARSWYQADNVAIEELFAKLIDDVNFNHATIKDALKSAETQVNVIMTRK